MARESNPKSKLTKAKSIHTTLDEDAQEEVLDWFDSTLDAEIKFQASQGLDKVKEDRISQDSQNAANQYDNVDGPIRNNSGPYQKRYRPNQTQTYGVASTLQESDNIPDDEASLDEVREWLKSLETKLVPNDVKYNPQLALFAIRFVRHYDKAENRHEIEDNDFMKDMIRAFYDWGKLTNGQAKGILNWIRAQEQYKARQQTRLANQLEAERQIRDNPDLMVDLRDLPKGMYADPNPNDPNNRLKVAVNKPDRGNWKGWIFVNDGAEYGRQKKYGAQKPGVEYYQGQIVDVLKRIVDNPDAAMAAYGRLTGTCGACNRKLEDELSVARGIGPICYAKLFG